jgi:hypothetical protein
VKNQYRSKGPCLILILLPDRVLDNKKKRNRPGSLPKAKIIRGVGNYIHFGLENALMGDSPGLVYKNADLFTYAAIYKDHPDYIHDSLRKKVKAYLIYTRTIIKTNFF